MQDYNANNIKINSTLSKIGEKHFASVIGINYFLNNILKTNKFKMHSLRYYRLHNGDEISFDLFITITMYSKGTISKLLKALVIFNGR